MTSAVLSATLVACVAAACTSTRRLARRPTAVRAHTPREAAFETARHREGQMLIRARLGRGQIEPSAVAAWIDALARSLRHGSTLHHALVNEIPASRAVARATAELRHRLERGASVSAAGDAWHASLAVDSTRRIELLATTASVISVCAELGGPAAAPLDRLAVAMRQRASDDLERSAQSAQARISARVLTLLPFAVLILLVASDGNVRSVVAQPTGGGVVALGVLFNCVGALWMRRIAAS